MDRENAKELFEEWVKNKEVELRESIEGCRVVLEIEGQQISMILELKEMKEYNGERAKAIMIGFAKLENELRERTMIEIKRFLKSNRDKSFPTFYS
ncbi:hypothetical protein ES708_04060 [subsurface metagenome]